MIPTLKGHPAMIRDLETALKHIRIAQPCLLRSLSKRHWPLIHENITHLIRDLQDILSSLAKGEQLPP